MTYRQSGIALVLVLWVVTLLAVIAGNFAFSMRGEAQIARNLLSTAQVQVQADAGVQRAWFELMKPPSDLQRWQPNGVVHDLKLEGAVVQVSLHDESGKIDLNSASDPLLQGLFRSVGLTADASAALIDAVLDWRDSDTLKRLHGAEEGDYRAIGRTYVPSNGPFETVDELQRVLGMTPDLYRKLAPALTVYSKQSGINTSVAPREVLLAIPGVNPAMVEQYLVQRQAQIASGQSVPTLAGVGTFASGAAVFPTYFVRSVAKMADGTMFVRHAVARITQDPKRPIYMLAWAEGDAE